jgi:hypothetical protein
MVYIGEAMFLDGVQDLIVGIRAGERAIEAERQGYWHVHIMLRGNPGGALSRRV